MSVSLLSQIAVDLFDSVLQDLSKNQEITVVKQDNDVFHEPHKIQQVASSVHNDLLCQTGSQQVLQKAVATRNETVVKTIISSMVTNISKLTHSASQCSSLSPETSISREASEIIDRVMGDIKITSEHNKKATPSAQSSEISLVSSEIVHGVTDNLLKKIQCSNKKKDCLASETPEKPGDYLVQRVQGLEGVQQCKASGKTVKKTKKSSSSPDCMKTQPLESSSHDVKVDELMSDIRIASEHNKEATPSAQSSEVSLVSSEIVHGVTDNLLKKIQLNCSSPESSTPQAAIDMETRSTGQLMCTKMDQLEPSPVIGRTVRNKKLQSPMTKSPKGFSPTVPSGFESSFQPEDTMDKPCSSRSLGEAVGVTPCSNKKKDCLASETPEKPGDYLVQRVQGLEGVQHCKASGKTFKKTKKSSSSPDCMKTQPLESSTHDVKVDELMSYIRIASEHNKEATPRVQSSEVSLVSSEIVHGVTDNLLKKIQLNCSSPESSTPQAAIDMESRSTEQLMCTKMDQLEPSPVIGRTVRSKNLQSPMTKSPKGFSPTVPSWFENSFQPEDTMDKPCSSRSLGEAVGVTPCSNKKKDCLASETPEKPGDYLVQRVQGLEGVQHCKASGKTVKKTKKSSSSPDCMKTQPLKSSSHDVKVDELMSDIRIAREHNKEATPSAQSSEVSLVSSEIVHGVTDNLLKKIQLNCSSPESSTPQAAIDMESRSTEQLMCTKMDQLEPSPVIGRTVRSKKLQSPMTKSPKGFSPTVPSGFENSFQPEYTMDKPCSSRSLGEAVDVTPCSNKKKDCLASETPEKPGDYLVQRVQGLEGVQHCKASGKTFKKTKKSSSSPDCMKTQPLESSTHDVKVDELMSYIRIGSEHIKEATPRAQSSEVSLVSSEIVHGVTDNLLKKTQLNCSSPESSTPQAAIDMETRSTEQLMCTKMDQLEPSPVIGRTVRSKKLQSPMTKSPKGFSPTVPSGFENSFQPEDTMDKPCSSRSLGEAVGVTPCSNKKKDCLASETPEKPGDYLVQRVQGLEGVQQCKASGKTVKKTKKSSSSPDCMKTQPLESSSHDVKVDELMSDIRIGSEHNKEATPIAQSSEVSLVSSEIVHGVTDNLLKKIQLNCSCPESSAEDLKRPLQTLSEMVISITESVIMQLSAVPGITIGTPDHDRCIFIQPLDADQMIEKVYNDLLQESGSLIALYDAIMSKNQEVSNAIIVSLVKELSKLYFSTAESSALGPSPSFITNEATNDVNSSENDTFNLGCQEKGMSPPEPASDIQPLSDIPLPYSDIVKKIVTKLLLRIHPISPKREKKQEQIMDSLSCWELSEFAVGIIDNVLKKLFTAPDTSECNPTMGSNIQCELVSVKQVASCIYRELLQSAGSKDNLQQAVAAKSEALAQKIVDSLVREIMKFQHSDIESSDAPQAAIDMETLSTEQLMCTKMDQLEPSPVMCQTDAVKNIMAKLLLKICPGFPNPENYSGELEELSESQVRDLALKLTKDALKELTKVSTLTISEPKAEEHLPLQQAIKKTVSSVYSKLMESIGSKKVLQVGIASQNPEMIKEMACCVAKETIANYGLRSGCSIPSSQSLISQKTSKSTQDKIVDTNVTTVRSKKLQSSMKKSLKGFSPTVPSGFENSFQPEDTMDKPCSSRSIGEAVGVTPCSNKKKGCSASETPEKPGDYLAQGVQDVEGVQQCKASGKTVKKTMKSSSRPDCMKTRLLESSSHDVVDEELPGHSSWYVYTPSLNKDKNLSPAQSKSGLRIDIAKHYMTPVQLTKTSESKGLLSHSNIPFAVNTPDEDVNVSQKVKKHPLKKFGSMLKHKIMGNRSKDVRIQNETNPSLENLRAQGTSSGRGSCESFGPFKVPDEYTEPQKHK
ncbi:fibrous sheath-interacting protein 2-like, partial [Lepisosteus oculatus]|uniref:fibrous sheath-interacting protein 2-like n=1 Tax=Lepisosteus oculatus TaxID=7918 RepID=UPI0035F50E33